MVLGETAVCAAGSAGCRPGAFASQYLPFIDEGAGNCCPQTASMALGHAGLLSGTRREPKYLPLPLRAVLKGWETASRGNSIPASPLALTHVLPD